MTGASPAGVQAGRGLLLQFSLQGCPLPPPILGGRVTVAGDSAVLQCNSGHLLQDSLQTVLQLVCSNTSLQWEPPVQHCVPAQQLLQGANSSAVRDKPATVYRQRACPTCWELLLDPHQAAPDRRAGPGPAGPAAAVRPAAGPHCTGGRPPRCRHRRPRRPRLAPQSGDYIMYFD